MQNIQLLCLDQILPYDSTLILCQLEINTIGYVIVVNFPQRFHTHVHIEYRLVPLHRDLSHIKCYVSFAYA